MTPATMAESIGVEVARDMVDEPAARIPKSRVIRILDVSGLETQVAQERRILKQGTGAGHDRVRPLMSIRSDGWDMAWTLQGLSRGCSG